MTLSNSVNRYDIVLARIRQERFPRGAKTHRDQIQAFPSCYKNTFRPNLDSNGLFCYQFKTKLAKIITEKPAMSLSLPSGALTYVNR